MANVLLRVSAVALAAFALALLYLRLPESGARADRAPCEGCNIVLISFDTVRADHLGTYGYARPTSPHVDALASRSVVFERAISQAPWTLPAHGSMFSGLYPSRLGVLRYPATRALPDKNVVLAEMLRTAGYATAGFTGGGFVSKHYGFDRGFDIYASRGRRFEHNLDPTIDWLDAHQNDQFFRFVHGYDAHRPYYSKSADKQVMSLPADSDPEMTKFCLRDDREVPNEQKRDRIVRYYDSAIHHGDRAIGALLMTLEKMKLMENTVILLTSDHGEEFFEHGNCDHVRFVYNEVLHVPYMIYVPGLTPGGRRIAGLTPASISVARTVLDLVGIDHAMPGVTLLPMIDGKQKFFPVVYSEADTAPGTLGSRGRALAMTKPDFKIISYTDEGVEEAYDLEHDPGEKEPLPERHIAYLMRQTMRSWAESLRPLPRAPNEPDAAAVAALAHEDDTTGADAADDGEQSEAAKPGAEGVEKQRQKPGPASERAKPPGAADKKPGAKQKKDKMPAELKESLKSLGYLE